MKTSVLRISAAIILAACVSAAGDDSKLTVNELMLSFITPATNAIWGVEEPQTDEDWQALAEAAQTVIDVSRRIKAGAAGPNDKTWATEPAWQAFADAMIESSNDLIAATEARDLDRFIEISNDKLYPPCEECHLRFHPAMQQQELN